MDNYNLNISVCGQMLEFPYNMSNSLVFIVPMQNLAGFRKKTFVTPRLLNEKKENKYCTE
jgi:hypothetical protein